MRKKKGPIRYHYRGRDNTDGTFIKLRMAVIPDHLKHDVSEHYEGLYGKGSQQERREANTYLHELAKKYRDKIKTRAEQVAAAKQGSNEKAQAMTDRLQRIQKSKTKQRNTIMNC